MNQTQKDIENILNTAFRVSYLPIHLFYKRHYLVSCCQSDSYNLISPFENIEFLDSKNNNSKSIIWYDSAFKDIFYGVLYIQPLYSCMIGPCSVRALSFGDSQKFAHAYHINSIQIPECSVSRVEALLMLLASAFQISVERPIKLTEKSDIQIAPSMDVSDHKIQQYQLDHAEQGFIHHSYKLEQDVHRFFLENDEESLTRYLSAISRETYGTMSHNPVKQEEYSAAIIVSFFARYAIDAGVEQFRAYDLADLYLQKISSQVSVEVYRTVIIDAAHRFMSEVKKARSLASQSQHIEKCKQYIYRNLNKSFSLDDLAEYVGLTPTYLSGLFSKYENTSIKEYTLHKRIEASQNMLKYSDYSISQIAYYFCFSSQSHFANIFKKYAGQTPSAFRSANKQV